MFTLGPRDSDLGCVDEVLPTEETPDVFKNSPFFGKESRVRL